MAFQLPQLPYALDALEKSIDARTLEIHHGKHHAGYVSKLNAALENTPDLAAKGIDDLLRGIDRVPEKIRQAVINHGGGHANHTLFWQVMSPKGGREPKNAVAKQIDKTFGGFSVFKEKFADAAANRFGSGWAWLVVDEKGLFQVYSTANQDSPLMKGHQPILGLDVWEHAYYLRYQNRRPDYIQAWWDVVAWDKVAEFYDAVRK